MSSMEIVGWLECFLALVIPSFNKISRVVPVPDHFLFRCVSSWWTWLGGSHGRQIHLVGSGVLRLRLGGFRWVPGSSLVSSHWGLWWCGCIGTILTLLWFNVARKFDVLCCFYGWSMSAELAYAASHFILTLLWFSILCWCTTEILLCSYGIVKDWLAYSMVWVI
jgi:hypothetical protein